MGTYWRYVIYELILLRQAHSCGMRLLVSNALLYSAVNFAGMYAKYLADWGQRKAFLETHRSMVTRQKTKRESDRQWKLFQSGKSHFIFLRFQLLFRFLGLYYTRGLWTLKGT